MGLSNKQETIVEKAKRWAGGGGLARRPAPLAIPQERGRLLVPSAQTRAHKQIFRAKSPFATATTGKTKQRAGNAKSELGGGPDKAGVLVTADAQGEASLNLSLPLRAWMLLQTP